MELSPDEQRLIALFRNLPPSGRDEVLAFAVSLARRIAPVPSSGDEASSGVNRIQGADGYPEAVDTPISTE